MPILLTVGHYLLPRTGLHWAAVWLLPLAWGAAALSYRYVEAPAQRLRGRLGLNREALRFAS